MYRMLLLAFGCCSILAAQQGSRTNWSVQDIRVGALTQIDTGVRTMKPNAGSKVLSVRALIRSANADRLLVRTGEVFIQTAQGAKSELAGVGIVNNSGVCSYELTKGLVSGFVGVKDAAGNGFELGRKTASEPMGIKMAKNPEPLCFAFVVAAGLKDATLHLEDAAARVSLP
jgi:hypothetical protein